MAKRPTGLTGKTKSDSRKTQKRFTLKKERLAELAGKKRRHNRISKVK